MSARRAPASIVARLTYCTVGRGSGALSSL